MTAALVALFVSSAAAAPSAIDAPPAPVHALAGKACQVEAVMVIEDPAKPLDLVRRTVHVTGTTKPAFKPRLDPRTIA